MHIAGGLYHELISVPHWHSILGSGGRAALAVSSLSSDIELHTYSSPDRQSAVNLLTSAEISVAVQNVSHGIAFAYFHPLARPHIEPRLDTIRREQPLIVAGGAVLRFGMLEGHAIIEAKRAVYDPQCNGIVESFSANGSKTEQLAIVLNEKELLRMAGATDLDAAARYVLHMECATIVVAKCGVRGAFVFELDGVGQHIPVYKTDHVIKIGTGDVFSAIFAHYWAERRTSAVEAANIASRTVAAYSQAGVLPASPIQIRDDQAIIAKVNGTVILEGNSHSLGQIYLLEQARMYLKELGVIVVCPLLDGNIINENKMAPNAFLYMADASSRSLKTGLKLAEQKGLPAVIYSEAAHDIIQEHEAEYNIEITCDFTTALYHAAWAALR